MTLKRLLGLVNFVIIFVGGGAAPGRGGLGHAGRHLRKVVARHPARLAPVMAL